LDHIAHVGVSSRINPKLIIGEIIFEVFQLVWSRYLNVTDRQTDGRTDDILWHSRALRSIARQNVVVLTGSTFKGCGGLLGGGHLTGDPNARTPVFGISSYATAYRQYWVFRHTESISVFAGIIHLYVYYCPSCEQFYVFLVLYTWLRLSTCY